ncbi:helix-turn-helix transcriptional regulator [Saccharothrix coeruleofusca]|uniref:Helix-turn-helix transcriptional regulator n=1 Tax=Saccharothrix coeruleofusca TaxID=33919 RepID=A0A918EEA1_9PSEU|nr:response regulator transcription factor [Saccharothrix coeruleofusca]MBP2337997.1 DNA-binding NarL/FixJ family response regulator [Saccharothrix coeruleofusca]GGP63627.1 helix-turn-helix transcriptional regulator [Saccharothrix coeruleofusca]
MGSGQLSVVLHAADSITRAGVTAALRSRPEIRLVEPERAETAVPHPVALVVLERLDAEAQQLIRRLQARNCPGIVLVTGDVAEADLLNVVSSGVSAVVRRAEATPEVLVRLVKATAAGEGALPPDLLGKLLSRVSRLQRNVLGPHGWTTAGMSDRETEVLRLIADGFETREIAEKLCYSQRTVKSILHDVTNRFGLRNRAHAVAFALREGLI